MKTSKFINPKELNEKIDPIELLRLIGYKKSSPKESNGEIRDYCPIHIGDHQRSLSINKNTHFYICHSCNETGDLIHLYSKCKGYDFPEAIEELSKRFLPHPLKENGKIESIIENKISNNTTADLDKIWGGLQISGTHTYLSQKKITTPLGVRFGKDKKGNHSIVVPFTDVNGSLQALQYINEQGIKIFLKGSKVKDHFFSLGEIKDGSIIYITEGLATAMTTWEALGKKITVLSVGSVGNIPNVIEAIRQQYTNVSIKIAIDNDKAARDVIEKIAPPFSWTYPNFENLPLPEGTTKVKDFNDLRSVCEISLEEIKKQVLENETQKNPKSFAKRLSEIIGDYEYAKKLENLSFASFIAEHKETISKGGLLLGFEKVDKEVYFTKGSFVTIQAPSNHGKSTFMLQMAYKFLSQDKNKKSDAMCIFITYESSPFKVQEKFLRIISQEKKEGILLKYNKDLEEKYLYPREEDFQKTINSFNFLATEKKIQILEPVPLEKLEDLINLYKQQYSDRTIILILDYIQIIKTSKTGEPWKIMKDVAHELQQLANDKKIIIVTGSQVNDKGQTREGRDIYHASTINIGFTNRSHPSIKNNPDTKNSYKEPIDGKGICDLSVQKNRDGSNFILYEYLLFNGHFFEEKEEQRY